MKPFQIRDGVGWVPDPRYGPNCTKTANPGDYVREIERLQKDNARYHQQQQDRNTMREVPANYLAKKGDVVFIAATVKYAFRPDDESVHLHLNGSHNSVLLSRNDIKGIDRFMFEEGSKVLLDENKVPYEIVAMRDAEAWIKDHLNNHTVVQMNRLTHYNAPAEPTNPDDSGPLPAMEPA